MSKEMKIKICSATFFVCVILHMLLGYFLQLSSGTLDGYWLGFLFYLMVPLMPFIVGLRKIHITFEVTIVFIYFTVCLVVQYVTAKQGNALYLWHPLWVIFLLIPIYHIFSKKTFAEKVKEEKEEFKKEAKKKWNSGWRRNSDDDDTIDV